jgi:predicted CoA-substrate-specific enzyme activase
MAMVAVGIDVGYLFSRVVGVDAEGHVVHHDCRRHGGQAMVVLVQQLGGLDAALETPVALTGSKVAAWDDGRGAWLHDARAMALAAATLDPRPAALLQVGATGVFLAEMDAEGRVRSFTGNTLCAAGTGSFLDEQAARLGISYDDPPVLPPDATIPAVATRCSVFAKSDLIHRQQEGFSREAMWAGLCRGMTSTLFQTLLKGRGLPGLTVLAGGVCRNPLVVQYACERFPGELEVMPDGHLAGGIGAALHARCGGSSLTLEKVRRLASGPAGTAGGDSERHPPLRLTRSHYPSFEAARSWIDHSGNELRQAGPGPMLPQAHRTNGSGGPTQSESFAPTRGGESGTPSPQPQASANAQEASGPLSPDLGPRSPVPASKVPVFLGLDVGSTSTKLAVLDGTGEVLVDIYRRTAGEPLAASRAVFEALFALADEQGMELDVRGLATTGSGRRLVGMVYGADVILNEITAHARGAASAAGGDVETIFEIGGQDAKYIRMQDGQVREANMNFVCSAGTGSFVEEQARKLGIPLTEVGTVTEGVSPPVTSDRCTVFMEQDMARLLSDGHTREEAMAAVLYSVVKNYLNKVVGNRQVSKRRVVFQGATARNRGLVAAFENLLGVEIVVSPFCHVMGSIGAALVARERVAGKSRFVGRSMLDRPVEIRHDRCELCSNQCRITHATGGASWGYLCGRDADGPALPMRQDRAFRMLRNMELERLRSTAEAARPELPVLGLPHSLSGLGLLPFWAGFCRALGLKLVQDGRTDAEVKEIGASLAAADFCFPVKAHLGHLRRVLSCPEVDFALVPYFISDVPNKHSTQSLICPYVESSPSLYQTVATRDEADRVLAPVLDFRWSDGKQADELYRVFSPIVPGLKPRQVKQALKAARAEMAAFEQEALDKGRKILDEVRREGKVAVVFVGRPYNVRDDGVNLSIPKLFSQQGYTILPLDMLPFRPDLLGEEFNNVFWAYGQRILSAVRQAAEDPALVAVYLTNFSCGPDSFLLTYAEAMMRDKPFLILELDEHGSEGGYQTRIEAFLDVVAGVGKKVSTASMRPWSSDKSEFDGRTLWIPPMQPTSARLFAAAFRAHGRDARMIPVETQAAFEMGRARCRGSECLPTSATIGGFLALLKERQLDPKKQAMFMGTANGPCRFGQYVLLHRQVLDQEGYSDIPILAPCSHNSYQGIGEDIRHLGFKALLAADNLFKARCRTAPYEMEPGSADALLEKWTVCMEDAVERREKLEPVLRAAVEEFSSLPMRNETKPLVGIVGEIYVRSNPFTNDYLVQAVERYGGEAWLTPITEWFLYTAQIQAWSASEGLNGLASRGLSVLKNEFMKRDEHHWSAVAGPYLADRREPSMAEVLAEGKKHLPLNFEGEAVITIGRAVLYARQGADMVVNAAPFGCMPGTLTTAILRKLQDDLGIPVVGMFYDGTPGLNRMLEPMLKGLVGRQKATTSAVPSRS